MINIHNVFTIVSYLILHTVFESKIEYHCLSYGKKDYFQMNI